MFARVKVWLAAAGAALLALLAAWGMGRREERQNAARQAAERRAEAGQTVRRMERESQSLDDNGLADRISRVRDKPR